MPPQIQALLENRRLMMIIGGAVALVLIILIVMGVMMNGGGSKIPALEKMKKDTVLARVTSIGRAIEIQALLARQGLQVEYDASQGDTKIDLKFHEDATYKDRDKALLAIVQSGLMDSNVGLEAFDKGDLTASREEKRIKLVRAQQGELARLIKKIDPIEDAAVSIAIPEPSIFRADEKPVTASVQVSLASGSTLTHDQVRAITNLVVGSIQGLDEKHVSISDTNGTTYNSILSSGADLGDELKEQDSYMRQKIVAQLDHLVGAGNYVVTVSTEVRQAPRETMVEQFDPQGAVLSSKQSFNENMNSNKITRAAVGPASIVLPNNLDNTAISNALPAAGNPLTGIAPVAGGVPLNNLNALGASMMGTAVPSGVVTSSTQPNGGKDYLRNGVEVSYRNSKTQWLETSPAGMVEDISVAVTIDSNHYPDSINLNDLQVLLARAASPKVRPENVSIARTDLRGGQAISGQGAGTENGGGIQPGSGNAPPPETPMDLSWMLWAGGAVLACLLIILILNMTRKPSPSPLDESFMQAQHEMQQLREISQQQQAQLQMTQQQTQMLMEAQQRQVEQALTMEENRGRYAHNPDAVLQPALAVGASGAMEYNAESLQETLADLREDLKHAADDPDSDLDIQIRNWIESS
jgi:flagellar biosynthesis/type III secretory pathway M-ring protein FliF/YscJ